MMTRRHPSFEQMTQVTQEQIKLSLTSWIGLAPILAFQSYQHKTCNLGNADQPSQPPPEMPCAWASQGTPLQPAEARAHRKCCHARRHQLYYRSLTNMTWSDMYDMV